MNLPVSHPAFSHVRSAHIQSLDIDVHEYRHDVTGTSHVHLAADNPENVFLVGLRTVPTDSTGVAHILEHTVLCGSEKYPVRDPFFMMMRRSLSTFMNAFTSTDWTAYPFASQNEKDFFNLLDVYLDAVFFSNLNELDFAQEGHRVEFEEADDPASDLVFKGVVFNEMKGAMSAPTSVLRQVMTKHMFPNNTYHFNSGGEPEDIPDLTYDDLKSFYDTHYHPSNAVFMTYGNLSPEVLQTRFEDQVLNRFSMLDRTISVKPAKRYHAPIRVQEHYSSQDADTRNKSHVVISWLLGESNNLDDRLRADLLSSVLLANSASPLRRVLEQTDLGSAPSPMCGMDDSGREMIMAFGLNGTNPEHTLETEKLILETLESVVEKGVPKEQIDAALHQLEMGQREIRGDGMPFGLQLVLSGLPTAMLRGDTLASIDLDPALERLFKDAQEPDFIQKLIRDLLLNNTHRVTVTLAPDTGISERRDLAERARLAMMKTSLTDEQERQIIERTEALNLRQAQEDDPEILPKVTLADVPADMHIPTASPATIADAPAMAYAQGTNGIVYQHVVVELPHMEKELEQLLPLYTSFVAELGSGGRDYLETQSLQAGVTGGIGTYTLRRSARDNEQSVTGFQIIRGKALLRNASALSQLLLDTLSNVRFDELSRMRELVAQARTGREQRITGSGHILAMMAAASGMSPTALLSHQQGGLAGISTLKKLDDSLDDPAALNNLGERFAAIHDILQSAPRQFMVISEEENLQICQESLTQAFDKAPAVCDQKAYSPAPVRQTTKELWTTSTDVNFNACAYPAVTSSHEDSAALTVLGPFLSNGFLHRAIRETGGAYGGGASYDADSAAFRFYSYRDPRLTETLEDFDNSIRWLKETSHEQRELEEAILSVVGSIDKPGSPAGEARNAFQAQLFDRTAELRRAFRQRILKVSLDDLKRVANTYFEPGTASTGVLTNEKTAEKNEVAGLGLNAYSV